ncbi:MAG: hypothetical protein DI538_03720 [Azospira oryzae]|nr:MAG: hypothetical protein DI538_03720 [Azospira oryzae]
MGLLFGFKFVLGLFDDEQRQRVTSVQGVLLLIGLIIGTAFICGGIYHWFFAVYRPKRLVKLFNKIKNLDLQELGLKVNEDEKIFSGYYKGYFLTIFTDSSPDTGDWVRTNAFIIPKETHEELYKKLQKKFELNTDNKLVCFTAKTKMKFGRTPKKDKLKADINDLVDTLRYERVEPLTVME